MDKAKSGLRVHAGAKAPIRGARLCKYQFLPRLHFVPKIGCICFNAARLLPRVKGSNNTNTIWSALLSDHPAFHPASVLPFLPLVNGGYQESQSQGLTL